MVANGSIFSVDDARNCLKVTGADGLMIGRAAPQKPWIFADIAREVFDCDIPHRQLTKPEIYLRMIQELDSRFRPERRLGRLKEFTHYFSRNYIYGHHLASAVQSSGSMHEAVHGAMMFFEKNDPDGLQAVLSHSGGEETIQRIGGLK